MKKQHTNAKDIFYALSNPDMIHGPIFKSMIYFSIPILLSTLFQSLYSMADSLIIGHALGETAYAAVGAGATVCELLIVFATGVGLGMSMVIARYFGAGDTNGIKKSSAACLIIGLLLSFLITVLGLFFLKDLLHLLNTPEEIFDGAYAYSRIIMINTFATFLYNMFCGMLKALGNSFIPLLYLIFSSFLNVGLDYLFIVGLNRGIPGAAEATALAQMISAFLCGWYILKKAPLLIPEKEHWKIDLSLYTDITWAGISMGLMNAIVMIGTLTLQYAINTLGTLTIVAHTAARKLFSFGTIVIGALASAVSMFVSQNYGAGQYTRIRKGLKYCYYFDFAYAIFTTAFFLLFSRAAVQLITGSQNAYVIDMGSKYLYFVGPFYSILGVLAQVRYAIQGIGQKILPMISSVIELIGKILFTFIFVPMFGYSAVILCEPLIWCVMTIQLLSTFYTQPAIRNAGKQHIS